MKTVYFRRFGLLTIISVYLLILVGGIVRSTGAGMGCPDWPKCFGQWVPPTSAEQLPPDYKTRFQVAGKVIADFDAFKTWTEYLNRLLGALIGVFIFITFLLSLSYRREDTLVTWLCFASVIATGFQGWLGSVVVATNLKPFVITLHMLMALVIVGMLLYILLRSYRRVLDYAPVQRLSQVNGWIFWCLLLSVLQVALGTQVRESMDSIAYALGEARRAEWISEMGISFYVHRSFSLLVLGSNLYLLWLLRRVAAHHGLLMQAALWVLVLFVLEILTGIAMAYFAVPRWAQPAHLLFATIAFGLQFVMLMAANYQRWFARDLAPASFQARTA